MSQGAAAARVPTRPVARPAARERPKPQLRVVAPAPRRSAGGLALLSVGLLVLGLLVLLLLNISIGKGAYELTNLQQEQRQLADDQQSLAEQVEAAGAPGELAAKAGKLGMVPNPGMPFVTLPDGTIQGKPEIALAPVKPAAKASRTATKSAGAAGAAVAAGKKLQKQADAKAASKKADDTIAGKSGTDRTTVEPTP